MENGKETQNKKIVNNESRQVRMNSKDSMHVKISESVNPNNIQRFSIKIPHISH